MLIPSLWASKHCHLPVGRGVVGEEVDYRLHSQDSSFSLHATGLTSFPTWILFFPLFLLFLIKFPRANMHTYSSGVNISGSGDNSIFMPDISQDILADLSSTCKSGHNIYILKWKIGEIFISVSHLFLSPLRSTLCRRWCVFFPLSWCCESMPSLYPPARLPECWISIWSTLKGPRKWWRTLGQNWGATGDGGWDSQL